MFEIGTKTKFKLLFTAALIYVSLLWYAYMSRAPICFYVNAQVLVCAYINVSVILFTQIYFKWSIKLKSNWIGLIILTSIWASKNLQSIHINKKVKLKFRHEHEHEESVVCMWVCVVKFVGPCPCQRGDPMLCI